MRNTSKMTTLENKFPLLAVEHGCIISKDADITVAFEVELPELYTVTGAEYEAIHGCWCKAIKVLPYFCVVHKQCPRPSAGKRSPARSARRRSKSPSLLPCAARPSAAHTARRSWK